MKKNSGNQQPTIILGVIGADCHAVGNKILDTFFTQQGFNVINLGVMVSQDEFIDAAIETEADAVLVSSLYGHGQIDCADFRGRCIERGVGGIVLYVGGNLVIGKQSFDETAAVFKEMGFDRVFSNDADLYQAETMLREDIARRRAMLHKKNRSGDKPDQ
jgi:methylaspartate mutase sigma subunit